MMPARPRPTEETGEAWHFIPPAILGLAALIAVTYQTVFVAPPNGPVAVLFSPATTRAEAWAATVQAGGLVIRETLDGHVLIVMPTHDHFAEEIKMSGAWAIMNPMIAGGCLTDSGTQPNT